MAKLNDKSDQQILFMRKCDDNTSLDDMYFLDEIKVISTHYDNVIRIFDYMHGKNRKIGLSYSDV